MSTRIDMPQYTEDRCSVCGCTDWAASWRGDLKLFLICRRFALTILPAILADATYQSSWRPRQGASDLQQFTAAFWKAQAINACSHRV